MRAAQGGEKLLEFISKGDFAVHVKNLAELQSLEHGLTGILEHCHAGDRLVESIYYQEFQQAERARIDAEHRQIVRAVASFREELKCATSDRTIAMILPGMDVVKLLRAHIVDEGELFSRFAGSLKPDKRIAGSKKATKSTRLKKRRRNLRPKPHRKGTDAVPYTLEPHPRTVRAKNSNNPHSVCQRREQAAVHGRPYPLNRKSAFAISLSHPTDPRKIRGFGVLSSHSSAGCQFLEVPIRVQGSGARGETFPG